VAERITLVGERVTMEPLELADAGDLLVAAAEDRSSYDFTLVPDSLSAMKAYIASALEDEATGWALPFKIRLSDRGGRTVGTTRFLDLAYWDERGPTWPPGRRSRGGHGTPTVGEIGSTWLAASAQGTGANTESKLLMLTHAFEAWGARRVTLKTDARNQRSRRAIEAIGAAFEGIRRAHVLATDGTARDTAYYSVLISEWPQVRRQLIDRLHARFPAGRA